MPSGETPPEAKVPSGEKPPEAKVPQGTKKPPSGGSIAPGLFTAWGVMEHNVSQFRL